MPGTVEERGIEEHGVAGGQRQLHVVPVEVLDELLLVDGEVAGSVLLRVREEHGRSGLHRHVPVGDRALQGQRRGEQVHVRGVPGGLLCGHEAQVVVPVRRLGGPARIDHVDLGGHLVAGAQPRLGDQGDEIVRVVVGEGLWVGQRELVGRAPHPVVGAGSGEVVPGGGPGLLLGPDQPLERGGRPVHDGTVREGALQHHHAGPALQGVRKLGLDLPPPRGVLDHGLQPGPVQQHVLLDGGGVGILGGIGDDLHVLAEVLEPAVGGGEPAGRAAGGGGVQGHGSSSLRQPSVQGLVQGLVQGQPSACRGAGQCPFPSGIPQSCTPRARQG